MPDKKPCRKELLHRIHVASFAVDDVKLYLDIHPCDTNAMEYFDEFQDMRKQALREYSRYYGPLTIDSACTPTEHWNWIHEPWPWQEGGC